MSKPQPTVTLEIRRKNKETGEVEVIHKEFKEIVQQNYEKRQTVLGEVIQTAGKIIDATLNSVSTPAHIQSLSDHRISICKGCDWYLSGEGKCDVTKTTKYIVTEETKQYFKKNIEVGDEVEVRGCGCNVGFKSKSAESFCPKFKWLSVNEVKYKNQYYGAKD